MCTQNGIAKKICGGILLVLLIGIPVSYKGEIKKADALVVTDIGNTLTNTIQTLTDIALEQKEFVLDGLFFDIAQRALQQMTNDILKWVNSGFDGNPAFVTDLLGYLLEVSDTVAGEFIYGDDLGTLCTPFKLDVRIALAIQYQETYREGFKKTGACTIDELGVDIEAFINGDFTAGGWSTWFETVLNPENTAVGAYVAGGAALDRKIAQERFATNEDIRNSDGFRSQKVCTGSGSSKRCVRTTPGSLIKSQAEFALQIPALSLINADEMNEVIGALFGNLAGAAITGVNGLLGLGGNTTYSNNSFGSSGNLSYLDAVAQESFNNSKRNQAGDNKIEQALITETRVLELELAIITEIEEVITLFTETRNPFESDSCWNLEIPIELVDTLDELTEKIPVTVSTIISLQDLSAQFDEATLASQQLRILQNLSSLQTAGLISGQTAAVEYDYFLNFELKEIIRIFTNDIQNEKNAC